MKHVRPEMAHKLAICMSQYGSSDLTDHYFIHDPVADTLFNETHASQAEAEQSAAQHAQTYPGSQVYPRPFALVAAADTGDIWIDPFGRPHIEYITIRDGGATVEVKMSGAEPVIFDVDHADWTVAVWR